EQLLGPIDGELLGDVDELAAAVVPPPRIALGVLVLHGRGHRGQDGRAGVVLGGDQAEGGPFAFELAGDGVRDLRVGLPKLVPAGSEVAHGPAPFPRRPSRRYTRGRGPGADVAEVRLNGARRAEQLGGESFAEIADLPR